MVLTTKPNSSNNINKDKAMKAIQSDMMVKLTLSIPKKMRSEFKIAAERKGTTMTNAVLEYVKEYIQKEV
jgi:uncharacterized phage protein gp47/JayE